MMMETDTSSLIGRAAEAAPKSGSGFSLDDAQQRAEIQPILMWLAGAGYRPVRSRRNSMRPTTKADEAAADRILTATRPDAPILAARLRAQMLVDLHRDAPDDSRTLDVFEADPVIVADLDTGWLVTESIFAARIGLFDSLNTLLQKPYLTEAACADMRRTLLMAFGDLHPDAQREWCHSEVRLEQGLAFLESRKPSDLIALADELRPVDAARGLWDSVRLFGIAAQMADATGSAVPPPASLLTTR